ncbi:MAG: MFS transporter [Alphaproteobacteria bacterium]|nr:MAG: MFS transporter [Alphaproteobacteria bacterium]
MITHAVSAAIVPPRSAWRSLLWTAPFTVLWTSLNYSLPVLPESGLPALAVRLMVHGLLALGLSLGLESTDLTPGQRRTTWLAIMVPFTLWAAVTWTAAINGVFRTSASPLPLLPAAIFLPVIIGAPLLLLSKRVGQLLDAMPTTWLVALQLYRVFGSQWLAYWLRGLLPGLWALPAGTGDVLTGLFAVWAAIALANGTAEGRKAAILWNIFGFADLALAITLGMIISPGPFQLILLNGPSIGLDGYPNVLTPAFVVPGSILLHALSLRQLRRRSRAEVATMIASPYSGRFLKTQIS